MLTETHLGAPRRSRSMPADARAELQRLFKAYDAACLDLDADAVAAIYDLPCLISAPEGNAAFATRAELRQMLARRFAHYRQDGIVSASLTSLELEAVAADFAVARVVWSLADRRDLDLASVPRRYTLRRSDTVPGRPWRIAHVVSLGNPTAGHLRAARPNLRLAQGSARIGPSPQPLSPMGRGA